MIGSRDTILSLVDDFCQANPAPNYSVSISAVSEGTNQQNKAFHKLLFLYWNSGCASDQTYDDLRNRAKLFAGESAVKYWVIVHGYGFSLLEERPDEPTGCIAKSWSEFSAKMRSMCISALIDEMCQAGVSGAEFDSILETI